MVTASQVQAEPHICLTIPMDMAITLKELAGSVAGDDRTTYRAHTDAIWSALAKAGVMSLSGEYRLSGEVSAKGLRT